MLTPTGYFFELIERTISSSLGGTEKRLGAAGA